MRVLVLGGEGMLGHKVYQVFRKRADTWVTFRQGSAEWLRHPLYSGATTAWQAPVDARNIATVVAAVNGLKPDVVVKCIGDRRNGRCAPSTTFAAQAVTTTR